jgi:hypothetical protein
MRKQTTIFLLLALAIAGLSFASDDDWPAFRGPNYDGTTNGSSFSPEKGNLAVSWRAKAGSGYSGVSVVGGKAITAFTDGDKDVLAAYDSKSGKELWRYQISPKYAESSSGRSILQRKGDVLRFMVIQLLHCPQTESLLYRSAVKKANR